MKDKFCILSIVPKNVIKLLLETLGMDESLRLIIALPKFNQIFCQTFQISDFDFLKTCQNTCENCAKPLMESTKKTCHDLYKWHGIPYGIGITGDVYFLDNVAETQKTKFGLCFICKLDYLVRTGWLTFYKRANGDTIKTMLWNFLRKNIFKFGFFIVANGKDSWQCKYTYEESFDKLVLKLYKSCPSLKKLKPFGKCVNGVFTCRFLSKQHVELSQTCYIQFLQIFAKYEQKANKYCSKLFSANKPIYFKRNMVNKEYFHDIDKKHPDFPKILRKKIQKLCKAKLIIHHHNGDIYWYRDYQKFQNDLFEEIQATLQEYRSQLKVKQWQKTKRFQKIKIVHMGPDFAYLGSFTTKWRLEYYMRNKKIVQN